MSFESLEQRRVLASTLGLDMDFQATAGNQAFISASSTVGYAFSVNRSIVIESLAIFDSDGLANDHQTRLWTATGTQLASVTLNSSDPTFGPARTGGSWRSESLATPIELAPGTYVIGAHYSGATPRDAIVRNPAASNLTLAPGISFVQDLAIAGNTFPNSSDPSVTLGTFGPSFVIRDAFQVTTLSDGFAADGQTSLREAIANANAIPGDETITFAPSLFTAGSQTITLNATNPAGEAVLRLTESVNIVGPGADKLTINANNLGNAFIISSADPAANFITSTLSGLTITGGNAAIGSGGGIFIRNANVSIVDSEIRNNAALNGGGIGFFANNTSSTNGNNARLVVRGSTIANNTSMGIGGGILAAGTGTAAIVSIENSTISGNTANGFSGGIDLTNANVTLRHATVTGNRSDNNNSGGETGGGADAGTGSTFQLFNSIVAGNFTGNGTTSSDLSGAGTIAAANSLIGDANSRGGITHGANGNIVGNAGTGALAITSILDSSLALNGGTTRVHALATSSPAIDAGAVLNPAITVDQRGTVRPQGALPDMGAFERPFVFDSANIVVTTADDELDANPSSNLSDISLREAIFLANSDPNATVITFATSLQNTALTLTTVDDTSFGNSMLAVTSNVTIRGPVEITRSTASGDARLFFVNASGTLALDTITLSNGEAVGGNGGESAAGGGGGGAGLGGAIFNRGNVSIVSSTLTNNVARGGNGGRSGVSGLSRGGASGGSLQAGGANPTNDNGVAGANGGGSGATLVQGVPNLVVPSGNLLLGANGANAGGGGGGGGGGFAFALSGATNPFAAGGVGGLGGFGGGGGGEGRGGGSATAAGLSNVASGGFGGGEGRSNGGGGGAGMGGAIFNDGGTLTVNNSTFSGNSAAAGNGGAGSGGSSSGQSGSGFGGAIFNRDGSVTIVSSTLANNVSSVGSGGSGAVASGTAIYNFQENAASVATVNITNSILSSTDFRVDAFNDLGTITGNNNLIEQNGNFPAAVIVSSAAPNLGPLQNNGGPTRTHALLTGSPAIDAGLSNTAPVPVHTYELNGNLSDSLGGPALVSLGGTLTSTGYSFAPNQGLTLSAANINGSDYSIELFFSFTTLSGFQKIIDFKDRTSDTGLYSSGTALTFFGGTLAVIGQFSPGVQHRVIVTRNDATDQVRGFIDGVQVFSFSDTTNLGVFTAANRIIRLFQDDTFFGGTEAASGFVDRINIYNTAIEVSPNVAETFDQRGTPFARIVGSQIDIGAFELDPVPTVSDIANQLTVSGVATAAIPFTIGDVGTATTALTVTATSSNASVVAASGIVLGGTGTNRTITLTPVAGSIGTTTITVTVTDAAGQMATDTFVLTVNTANNSPTISDILSLSTDFNTATPAIGFVIGDVETAMSALVVTAVSSNQSIVPNANIVLGGADANRTITVTPANNQSGPVTITVTVTDAGQAIATDTFTLTVNPANTAPTITMITDQVTPFATATPEIAFTIDDDTTPVNAIGVTATSSNPLLVPNSSIVLAGATASRTVTITPDSNQFGTTTITITATDVQLLTTTRTFVLTVSPPPSDFGDAPATYPTLLPAGASHRAVGATLGSRRDVELDGQPDAAATGDDAAVGFADAIRIATGTAGRTASTAVGDLNGDGRADLVVAVSTPDSLAVLLGNGDGTFGAPTQFGLGTGTGAVFVVLSDFNGDTRLDAAVANGTSSNVSLLLGNGNGTFQAATVISLGNVPSAFPLVAFGVNEIAAADVNGDNRADLIAINTLSDDITVLLGNGNGTFAAPLSYSTFAPPLNFGGMGLSLIVRDLDADGDRDVVVANGFSNDVTVMLNSGTGVFTSAKQNLIDPNPLAPNNSSGSGSVVAGDFTGDGRLDLLTANFNSGDLSLLAGNGTDTFSARPPIPIPGAVFLSTVQAIDLNGDGNLDVVVTDQGPQGGTGSVFVLLGTGNVNAPFSSPTRLTGGLLATDAPFRLALADLTGDGRVEIVTDTGTVVAFFSPAQGDEDGVTFPVAAIGTTAQGSVTVNLQNADPVSNTLDAWIDFNRDGDWSDAGEQIFVSRSLGTANGSQTLSFVIPSGVVAGTSFARFRLSKAGINTPSGFAVDGEVEDHRVNLVVPVQSGFAIAETAGSTTVTEGGSTDTFTVVLTTQPTSNVVITVTSADTGEVTIDKPTLTFTAANWNVPQVVTVTGVNDAIIDGNQNTLVTLSVDDANSDNTFDPLAEQTLTVTTTDDEVAGFTLSKNIAAVSEAATTDMFTVVLTAQPASAVVITVSSADTGEATVDKSTLTFTDANWNVPQVVIMTGVDDSQVDGNQVTLVTLSIDDTNSDNAFDPLADLTVSVTTTDNDGPGYTITQTGSSTTVTEGGSTDTFTVVLTAQPTSNVVLTLTSADTGEVTIDKPTLTFTAVNWNVPQVVTVTGVNDAIIDGSQNTLVTLSVDDANSDNAFDPLADQTLTVTTTDDDTLLDFGDAPGPYPVSLANDGARHVTGSLFLGTLVDGEVNGVNSPAANSDDSAGADEDGVFVLASFITSTVVTTSSFAVIASGPGKLDAWIDFNNDGDWLDAGERIFASTNLIAGENLLSFDIPANATASSTGARFRFSTAGALAPTGAAADGEVEDYIAVIAPGSSSATLNIGLPSGEVRAVVEGENLVVRRGAAVISRVPFTGFGSLNFNGSSLDDILELTILESLINQTLEFDGGLGKDIIELVSAGQTLDLTGTKVTLRDVEGIDIAGSGSNRLIISVDRVKAASTTTDKLEVVANSDDTITFGPGFKVETPAFIDGRFTHILTETTSGGTARVELRNDRLLTNPLNRFDADRDGSILPLDALRIINELRRRGAGPFTLPTNDGEISRLYFDVSGDNFLTPLDALRIINALARIARGGQAEGESNSLLVGPIQSSGPSSVQDEQPEAIQTEFALSRPVAVPSKIESAASKASLIDDVMCEYGINEDESLPSDLELLSMER